MRGVSSIARFSRRVRVGTVLAAIPLAALVLAVWAPVGAASPSIDVSVEKFAFAPKEITIAPGTRIVWVNHDETPHTVVSNDKTFASKGLDTDDRFEHTFEREGDFNYICSLHPFMTGVVHVHKP
jgi:plastocyanin